MAQFRTTYDAHMVYVADVSTKPDNRPKWRYVAQFPDILAAYDMRKMLRAEGFAVEIRYKKRKNNLNNRLGCGSNFCAAIH